MDLLPWSRESWWHNKYGDASASIRNMLFSIAQSKGRIRKLVELSQDMLNEKDFLYVILSTFAFILILSYESNINVLRKTLTTTYLTNKRGEIVKKEIEEVAPANLLSMLRKYSRDPVKEEISIYLVLWNAKIFQTSLMK